MSNSMGEFPVYAGEARVGTVKIKQSGLMTVFDCVCTYKSSEVLRLAAVCTDKYVPLGVMMPESGTLHYNKSFSKNTLTAIGYTHAAAFHLIRPDDMYRVAAENPSAALPIIPDELSAPEPAVQETDQPANEAVVKDLSEQLMSALLQMTATPNPDSVEFVPQVTAENTPEDEEGWYRAANPAMLFVDQDIGASCVGITDALTKKQEDCTLLAVPFSPDAPFSLMPIFCFGSSRLIGKSEYIVFKIKNGYLTL